MRTIYQQFMQSIYDAVLITDLQGAVVDANGRANEFFLCDLKELCTKTIFDIICGPMRKFWAQLSATSK